MRPNIYKNILIICYLFFGFFYLVYFFPAATDNNLGFEALLLGILAVSIVIATYAYFWHLPKVKTREENSSINLSLDNMPFGLALFNQEKEVIVSNSALNQILDLSGRINFNSLTSVFNKSLNLKEKFNDCLTTKKYSIFPNIKAGKLILSVEFVPVFKNKFSGCAIVIRNTTNESQHNRMREEFFAMASHELRSPLASIRGNMSLIMEYYAKDIKNSEVIGILSQSHSSAVRLIQIVNDFLDVSRLEQGKNIFYITSADVPNLANEVISELSYLATSKGLHLYFPDPGKLPSAAADPNRLKQVIYNLLSNAIHYTGTGSIKISVFPEKDNLKFTIEDTGMGIAKDRQTHLFEKFQPISTDALKSSGQSTGIGLYISKLLMDAQGGTIGLEKSEPGKGSTFYFTIPISKT